MNQEIEAVNALDTPVGKQSDDEIIAEAKTYLEQHLRDFGDNQREALLDLTMLAGGKGQWDDKAVRQRELDGRPCLTVNKLPTFLHQVTNDQRQNQSSIKVSPVGDHSDIDTAEVVQGLIRHIEYDSNADVATDTAVNGAATIGFGYWRLITDYCDEMSFDQDILFQRIRNPFTVAFDPDSTESDGSDQTRCLIHTKCNPVAFKLQWPDATATTEGLGQGLATDRNRMWLDRDYIRVGEYYRVEKTPEELVMMSDGGIFWRSDVPAELPSTIREVSKRRSYRKKVMLYTITAIEVLAKTEIKCDWIPVFPCYGAEIDLDGKVLRNGLIRNARDPQKMYNFWMTSATEEVALRPKTPHIGAEGSFEGHENMWQQANVRSFPFLEYKPVVTEGVMAPPPARQQMADIPNGMLTMAMHANDNIKATTGLFDSSLGAAGNAQSGKQEIAQQRQGNISNYHFSDNLKRSYRHCGRCLMSMIPHYYDTERVVNIMREDGEVSQAPINKQLSQGEAQQMQAEAQKAAPKGIKVAIKRVLNDVTVGKYAIVISVGPNFATKRQEATEAMIQFGQSWPKLMDIAGDKVVKAMDWPGAQGIAERIERTILPAIRYDPNDPNAGPPPLPPEVEAKMQEMQQQMAELQQENMLYKAGVQKEEIKTHSNEAIAQHKSETEKQIAQIEADTKKDVEEIKGYVALILQKLEPKEPLVAEGRKDIAS